ncbi:pantoate--beta-alanine ligase [Paenibacillus physcomitrellae]|uniref:Pantothenate synthetase n=1 Tax=Paenibacillus physcomitrellae TaxID=1619311 RepID=A0ABQ1FN25_9BACL|nr:pantoate--beta-alanine ligase [Paenibacillus physcomitrellae]GGA23311.1 pantoate--beta-alanine ligase [Paenibacillus physcomitrellae]
MIIIKEPKELQQEIKSRRFEAAKQGQQLTVGLVPTMGYLHEGHASLIRKARVNDVVVLSIFVNPIQFGPNEDLDRYPRDAARDLALAEKEQVDIVFMPEVQHMYPKPTKTKIQVEGLTSSLCGASRPGHFDGVTTVVAKLFHMTSPDFAYFGMKDAQQVAVLSQMVTDLNMDVQLVPCPIVRESDGLALSSRNVYLSEEQRSQALVLSASLKEAYGLVQEKKLTIAGELKKLLVERIETKPLAEIDYVEVLTFPELEPLDEQTRLDEYPGDIIAALAVKFGSTRLIDNMLLQKKDVALHV